MKKIKSLVLGLFCFGLMTAPCSAGGLDEGFSGIRWGTPIEEIESLQSVGSKGKVDYYVHSNAVHEYGGIRIPHVLYGFHGGRLFAAFAHIDTIEVFAQMRSQLQADYGIPVVKYQSESGQPTEYRWKKGELKLKLKVQRWSRKMKLGIYYTPISKKVNELEQERFTETGIRVLPRRRLNSFNNIRLLDF